MDAYSGGPGNLERTSAKNKNALKSAFAQLLATLIESGLLVCIGIKMSMPTLVLAALHKRPEEKLNMNDAQASWFSSLSSFTHPIGSVFSGYLQERFGRKGSMLLVTIPILVAWLTLYFADSMEALYAGAILIGLCCGLAEAPLHSYIGEIAEPQYRGTLSTLSTASVSVSALVTYILGYLFDWRTMLLISAGISAVTFVFMTQIPESPTWLIAKNRLEDAQKALSWLRGWVRPQEVQREFLDLVEYTRTSMKKRKNETLLLKNNNEAQSNRNAELLVPQRDGFIKTKFKDIVDKKVLLPLRMVFVVMLICPATSLMPLKPYLVGIFKKLGTPIDAKLVLIIYGTVFVAGMFLNMAFLWRFGKRKLALFSQVVGTASIFLLGIYCTFLGTNLFPTLSWGPVALILLIKFTSGVGLIPLPWQLISEVFPPKGRGTAGGLSAAWAHVVISIAVKSFLYLEKRLTFGGVMYLYGTIATLGTLYIYMYLPETEGKPLEQIESYFTKNHDRKEKFSYGKSRSKEESPSDLFQRTQFVKCPSEEP